MHSLLTRQPLRAFLPICVLSIGNFVCGNSCTAGAVEAADAGAGATGTSGRPVSVAHSYSTNKLPLSFEVNRGQADSRAKFLARGRDVGLFFTDQGAVLALTKPAPHDDHRLPGAPLQRDAALPQTRQALALRYRFAGANRHPKIEALDPLPGHSNYFIGNDPKRWYTDIPQYQRVRYHDVYPGVNVVYYGKDGQLEFDVEAAAGVDLAQVRLRVEGAEALALDDEGNLQLHTTLGVLTQRKPVVYQMIAGERRELNGDYVLRDIHLDKSAHEVAFRVADYDRRYALVLDPSLIFAKLIGGTLNDVGNGVAVDASGNSYVTGYTNSAGFPTTVGAYQSPGRAGYDAFITKISANGTALLYSALIGGSSTDWAYGIRVDSAGKAYITGYTVSSNFPTVNALQSTNPGIQSGFVTALNVTGNALIYSTYLGGNSGGTISEAIAVDPAGNAYVTGLIYGPGLPVSAGTFQGTNGGGEDAFVFKFDPTGARVYGTYLGGAGDEEGRAIAVDSDGDAYIAGGTGSTSFNGVTPNTIGPLGGTFAILIAELNPAGTGLVYATKIGGDQQDEAIGIAVDGGHQVYFTAFSNSHNLPPATPPQYAGGLYEAYIGHLDDSGTVLYDFTWYGSTAAQDYGYAVDLDQSRQSLYVVGQIQTLFPGDTTLGGTQSINAVPGLDCASSCAASTGAFLLQYTLNPLTLVSATRVTGGSATSNAIFTAVAHDPVTGHVATVGSSDANPPTTVASNAVAAAAPGNQQAISPNANAGGDDLFEAIIAYANSLPPQPPIIDKRFDPPTIIKGRQVDLTVVVTNPNEATATDNLSLLDVLPTCLSLVLSKPIFVFTPPSCSAFFGHPLSTIRGFAIDQYEGTPLPPGTVCSITFKVQAIGPEPCDNVTQIPTSAQGSGKPAKAHLEITAAPGSTWTGNGGNGAMSNGANWVGSVAPASGNDVTFPSGVAQTTVTNDLSLAQAINQANLSGTGYKLGGSPVNLLAGVNNSGANNTISAQIKASLPLVFTSDPAGTALNLSGGVNLNGYNIDFTGAGTFNVGQIVGVGDVNGDGTADIIIGASPSFIGTFNVAAGRWEIDASENEPVNVFGNGTVRGMGLSFGAIVISDTGDFHPCIGTTECTSSVASLTCNGGTVEVDCAANNTSCTSINDSGAVPIAAGTTLKLDFQTVPAVGTTFTNLISAPGTGTNTITGCFGETAATPANVLLKAQCTPTSVSATVKAVDDVFHSGFGG